MTGAKYISYNTGNLISNGFAQPSSGPGPLTKPNRICKALYANMMMRGTESGKGMTREQSIKYLRWILGKLELQFVEGGATFNITEFEPPAPKKPGMRQQFHDDDAELSRNDYEQWVSWAVGLICDWPENLFCGESSGDGNGKKTDWPINMATSDRVRKAAEKMRYYIYGRYCLPTFSCVSMDEI